MALFFFRHIKYFLGGTFVMTLKAINHFRGRIYAADMANQYTQCIPLPHDLRFTTRIRHQCILS